METLRRITISNQNKKTKLLKCDKYMLVSAILLITVIVLPYISSIDRNVRLSMIALSFICYFAGLFHSGNRQMILNSLSILIVCVVLDTLTYYAQWTTYIGLFEKNYSMLLFWLPILYAMYCADAEKAELCNRLYKYMIFIYLFVTITTVSGLISYPMAARQLASSQNTDLYWKMNIGGYGFIYGLVLAMPVIFRKLKSKNVVLYLIISILFVYCIVKSQYSFAYIFLFPSLLLLCFPRMTYKRTITSIAVIIIVAVLTILLFDNSIANMLNGVAKYFYSQSIDRVAETSEEIARYISGGYITGDMQLRFGYYMGSIDAFVSNPITGLLFFKSGLVVGGHAEILDVAGGCGILGLSMLIWIIRRYIKYIAANVKNQYGLELIKIVLLMFLMFACVNPVFNLPNISIAAFLLPVIYANMKDSGNVRVKLITK